MILVLPLWGHGQVAAFRADSIPMLDGKVVFHVDLTSAVNKADARAKASAYLNDVLNPYKGELLVNSEDHLICRITDYVPVTSTVLQKTGMYMRYRMKLEFKDRTCALTIWDLTYVEKQYYEAQEQYSRKLFIPEYSAKDIMLEGRYRVLFVKNASQKLTQASIDRINGIVKDLEGLFSNANK